MSCTQLTHEERYQIYVLKKTGQNQAQIAEILDQPGAASEPRSEALPAESGP